MIIASTNCKYKLKAWFTKKQKKKVRLKKRTETRWGKIDQNTYNRLHDEVKLCYL